RVSLKHGGIAQYLGGDNILVILPDHGYEALVEEIASNTSLKVGVGISFRPRTAVMLATKALDQIRSGYVENNINVLTG
ncbi:MAG: GTP cyclohydrolase IIa, partial [Desulfurococcales archaeon]|nr:GTP cyclohydrolase IIa [Desulfurococcales archaeon]